MNQDGVTNNYYGDVYYDIYSNPTAGRAVQQFIRKPLGDGIEEMRLTRRGTDEKITVNKDEGYAFIPAMQAEEDFNDNEVIMSLMIESPHFTRGMKWRFDDGSSTFWADIKDEAFLNAVDRRDYRFGKGDMLLAKLKIEQINQNGKLTTNRTIIDVIDYQEAPKTEELF